jgi:hypothetical protein
MPWQRPSTRRYSFAYAFCACHGSVRCSVPQGRALFSRLGVQSIKHCTSLYDDDFIMLFSPTSIDLELCRTIFQVFEEASGLGCNLSKCQMAPIRCNPVQIQVTVVAFLCQVVDSPIKYHGLPMSIKKLPRSALQPLADKVADRLLTW